MRESLRKKLFDNTFASLTDPKEREKAQIELKRKEQEQENMVEAVFIQ